MNFPGMPVFEGKGVEFKIVTSMNKEGEHDDVDAGPGVFTNAICFLIPYCSQSERKYQSKDLNHCQPLRLE